MPDLAFFDCNGTFGSRTTPRPDDDLSDDEILDLLREHGIHHVLGFHAHAAEYDPHAGNERMAALGREARGVRIHRCFALLPHHTGEMPRGDELVAYLRAQDALAVRLLPQLQSFDLSERTCGELLSTLAGAGVPVFLPSDQVSWREIDDVCTRHADLAVVILRVGYRSDRVIYPLLEKHPKLHLETGLYVGHRAIEDVAERFGAHRLVFGTGAPIYAPGGAIAPVTYAELSGADKQAIAGGNLAALLGLKGAWAGGEAS